MKKTIKDSLKRLLTGFVSSIMMLSFVLMPIPRIGVVYAEETATPAAGCRTDEQQEGDVYVPGCDFNDALNAASFQSTARYNEKGEKFLEKLPGFIEQYIVALTGVILINSLNYQRLHKYNPVAYGNDCATNFGAKFGIPVAALSGLSMVAGDLISNIKFQKLAKDAADLAFVPQARASGEGTEEGLREDNNQTDSYNALISIIEGQIEALKIKKGTALASAIGYGVADGVEIANMVTMNSVCTAQTAALDTKKATTDASYTAALQAVSAQIAANNAYCVTPPTCAAAQTANVACGLLQGNIGAFYARETALDVSEVGLGVKKAKDYFKKGKEISDGFQFLNGLASLSGTSLLVDGVSKAAEASGGAIDITLDQAEEIEATSVSAAVATKFGTEVTTAKTQLATIKVNYMACGLPTGVVPLQTAVDQYTGAAEAERTTKVQCCGGDGLTAPLETVLKGAKISDNYFTIMYSEGIEQATKLSLKEIVKQVVNNLIGVPRVVSFSEGLEVEGSGTLPSQGIPRVSASSFNRDIKIKNLFSGSGRANYTPELDNKTFQEIESLKFFAKTSFEAELRKFVMASFNLDHGLNPQEKLAEFYNLNVKMNKIMNSFHNYLEKDFYYFQRGEGMNNNLPEMRNLIGQVTSLIVPSAQAGLGATLVGFGVSGVGRTLDGPWSSVLNLGGNIITLHGILGKFMKRTGLTSPIGRTLTWAAMSAMSGVSYNMTKKSQEDAERNLEIVRSERDKFMGVSENTSGLGEGQTGVALNLTSVNTADPNGFKGKTACFQKNGSGYSPAVCGPTRSREDFTVPSLQYNSKSGNGSIYMQGANLLSDFNTLGANGKMTGDSFDSSTLAKMEKINSAIRAKNDKSRKLLDEMNKKDLEKEKIKGSLPSFQERVAKIRKSILDSSGKFQFKGADPAKLAKEDKEKDKKKNDSLPTGYAIPKGAAATATTPGMDLDFSQDDGLLDDLASDKEAISMNDFKVNHDDISKKKDVSIFKILSKRYIQTYPTFMKEKK